MFSLKLFVLCVGYFALGAECGKVSYIDKCVWTDKACLLTSGNKVVPHFVEGIKELNTPSVDPLFIKKAVADSGTLKLKFEDLTVVGLKKAVLKKVEANNDKTVLTVVIETPIEVKGVYTAGGSLLSVPVEGHGQTEMKTEKVKLTVKANLQKFNKNGAEHYKIATYDLKFNFIEQLFIEFHNLFNGDNTKADPIRAIIRESWRDLVPEIGKPIIKELADIVIAAMNKFLAGLPIDELEIIA
ncbi:uncharacterized protein LOC119191557 [Manduca sexta]|uniref:uncharacterized protein LOC119189798 n=2 Tax=Manduca sexta TaxID=7130 RepID=UPI0018906E59|nr:uncharacterized protein LOC119189798 [Manduca sexta]XP_037301342.1 uncharacterized protein LOC119191556 [Manduca sexta]XP_037301343.1 uncharacterized protein LOC119191557 [Manduca sexta]